MENTINSHNSDDKTKLTLNELQENWKDKLSALSDEELQQLKQQAIEAEDYDIAKLIKQEQTERAERAKETWEDVKDEDNLQELEDQTKREEWKSIQEKKVQSKEEAMAKVTDLMAQLNDNQDTVEENTQQATVVETWKDELVWLLDEDQERYNYLGEDEKKQFRIFRDISKILDNNDEKIKEYQEKQKRREMMWNYWDVSGDYLKKLDDEIDENAKAIVNGLNKDLNNYSRLHWNEINSTQMKNMFDELKYIFNKWVFREESYEKVFSEIFDILQDIKKSLKNEKNFKSEVHNIKNIIPHEM